MLFLVYNSDGLIRTPRAFRCPCGTLSASQFPRSRNRGRNRGISYLKWNFQCGTEKNGKCFFTIGPLLQCHSPVHLIKTNRTRRHVKNISVNLCPAWLVFADRASTASRPTDFPNYKRRPSTNVFHASCGGFMPIATGDPPPPTHTHTHTPSPLPLRNSRRPGRGNVVVAHACTRYGRQLQRGIYGT